MARTTSAKTSTTDKKKDISDRKERGDAEGRRERTVGVTARKRSSRRSTSSWWPARWRTSRRRSLPPGVADLTRAADAARVADRMGQLSEVVAAAGDVDIAQAIHLLSASEDVEVMSAVVGVMSEADLEHGLQLARLSGELRVAGDIVDLLEMPVLAGFLESRGDRVNGMAVNAVLRSTSTRVLAAAMAATGTDLASLSVENVADGIVRLAAADAMAMRSGELAVASAVAGRTRGGGVGHRRGAWTRRRGN